MVSTQKKKQSNRRLLSPLDDFDRDVSIGDAPNSGQQNVRLKEGNIDQQFTANKSGSLSTTKENTAHVQALERCFNGRIDRR